MNNLQQTGLLVSWSQVKTLYLHNVTLYEII